MNVLSEVQPFDLKLRFLPKRLEFGQESRECNKVRDFGGFSHVCLTHFETMPGKYVSYFFLKGGYQHSEKRCQQPYQESHFWFQDVR